MLHASRSTAPVPIAAVDAHEGRVYAAAENAVHFTTSRPRVAIRRLELDGDRALRVSTLPAPPNRCRSATPADALRTGAALLRLPAGGA